MTAPSATPTRTPGTAGFDDFELPLAGNVRREKVQPDEYQRIDPPQPTGTVPVSGDLIRVDGRGHSGIIYVEAATGPTVEGTWLTGEAHGESPSLSVEELAHAVEYGRAEKLSSGLSERQARYLLGCEPARSDDSTTSRSVSSLTFTREYSKAVVDQFINHPDVEHRLGANYVSDRATFGARVGGPDGPIAAVVVLSIPTGRMLNQYATGELKRFAAHPQAPKNTASWLISRSLQWCELEGYSALRSYAGIAANEGTIYQALGFEPIEADADEGDDQLTLSASADEQTTPALSDGGTTVPEANMVDASGWANSREGRVEMESYLQRRYEYRFTEADRVRRPEPQPLSASSGPESASLADYGVVDKSGYTPSDDLLTGDVSDVTQTHPDCLFERWDTRPRAVASALVRYGDQTATEATDPLWDATDEGDVEAAFEAAFAAATADGIAAVVVVDEPDEQGRWDFGTLEITGYAAVETGHPSNMAATLLARVRDWAGLQGYSTVRGTAQPGSTLHEALGQAGFDCQRRADHIVATADS